MMDQVLPCSNQSPYDVGFTTVTTNLGEKDIFQSLNTYLPEQALGDIRTV